MTHDGICATLIIIGMLCFTAGLCRSMETKQDKWGWFVIGSLLVVYPLAYLPFR